MYENNFMNHLRAIIRKRVVYKNRSDPLGKRGLVVVDRRSPEHTSKVSLLPILIFLIAIVLLPFHLEETAGTHA